MTAERRAGVGMARLVATLALVVPAIIGATASSSRADAGDTPWTTGARCRRQLGDATTASRTTFGPVSGLVDVDAVRGGREHLVALVGGTVWSWGDGSKGATGLGSLTDRSTPTQVPGLSTVTSIAAATTTPWRCWPTDRSARGVSTRWASSATARFGSGCPRYRSRACQTSWTSLPAAT